MIVRLAAVLLLFLAAPVAANWCAIPAKDGSAVVSGTVNTYFPTSIDRAAGSTTLTLGAAHPAGAQTGITAGDLLLVIQMQDARIATNNNDRYGDNVNNDGYGGGYTQIGQTGLYEFVRATSNVSAAGGTVSIQGATGGGLVNSYLYTASSNSDTAYRESYQIIRVPQYDQATISGSVTGAPWNGSSGGIVALDVARRLTFSGGNINVSGLGFRGGAGRQLTGGSGNADDYRRDATNDAHGSKGEGIVGTPRYVNNGGVLQNTGFEGIPLGSYARGAPGNAGGGGSDGNPSANDENSGGGGGGNGGRGGRGGHSWCPGAPNGCEQSGGFGGSAIDELGVTRLSLGGGGGAGTNNNGTGTPGAGFASSGAAGGGMVIVRAGEIAGTGGILADGANANSTVVNDGTGGGGAGGSVLLSSVRQVAGTSLSVSARGGNGGSNTGGGAAHGPGGGGGGGFVASSFTVASNVSGGLGGTTQNGGGFGANYGSTGGNGGSGISITGANIPGASSGGECTPTIAKSFAKSPLSPGVTSRIEIVVTNNNPTRNLTALTFTDTYPAGLINTASPAAAKSCGTAATLAAAAGGGSFAVSAATINAGSSCTYSVNTTVNSHGDKTNVIAAGGLTGSYGTAVQSLTDASAVLEVSPPLTVLKSSQAYYDPINGTTNAKAIPGAYMAYTLTVTNPGSASPTSNSIFVVDPTPPGLDLYVANLPNVSGPVLFTDGSPVSGLSYSFGGLTSTVDNVDFSNDGGATWTYTPAPNAAGVDPAVTHIRIRPQGPMAQNSSFTLNIAYQIE